MAALSGGGMEKAKIGGSSGASVTPKSYRYLVRSPTFADVG